MSPNRSNDAVPVLLGPTAGGGGAEAAAGCGGLAGALQSAATSGSTAVRRSWSLNSELKVGAVWAAESGEAAAGGAEAAGGGVRGTAAAAGAGAAAAAYTLVMAATSV